MALLKALAIMAVVAIGLEIIPLILTILSAVLPILATGFAIIFPILAVGAIVGYCLKKG